jgi:uncharacterized repeat protein (TIGR03803 family)
MSTPKLLITAATTVLLALGLFFTTSRAAAQTETVLHAFSGSDGVSPSLSLIFDPAGNLYGTASEGGSSNNGTVFELSPKGSSWTEKTLLSFNGGSGGSQPVGGLISDSSGNLYGTTKLGGANGGGLVFELSKSSSGSWTEKILHNFGSGKDGKFPTASLVFDASGNLYGTTEGGGAYGDGTESTGGIAFKLAPSSGSTWTEAVIHSFGHGTDGANPRCNLTLDSSGNVYGTTMHGGAPDWGAVFEISPQAHGGWKEQLLYSFDPEDVFIDGLTPVAGVIFDALGNIYGTTLYGGDRGGGIVFELSLNSGVWTENILTSFEQPFFQPSTLYSGLIFDSAGNLYGTTLRGAGTSTLYDGTVYKLTPTVSGTWTNTTLFAFGANHGAVPGVGSLVLDSSGNVYGATQAGGANKDGVVFEITQ